MSKKIEIIDIAKSAVKNGLYYGGFYKFLEMLKKPKDNRLLILMYHDFKEESGQSYDWYYDENPNAVQFDKVLDTLIKYFRVITVDEAAEELLTTGKLKEKSVAITIDDGYLSNYKIAFPLLKKHDLKATIFLTSDWIGRDIYPWWVQFADYIRNCEIDHDLIQKTECILGRSIDFDFTNERDINLQKSLFYNEVENIIRRKEDNERLDILKTLGEAFTGNRHIEQSKTYMLNWEQIKEMAQYGIRFGAHTCSHINLSFSDLESGEREIAESKSEIERHANLEVTGFAYPYGHDVNAYKKFIPILKKHGYTYACVSQTGNVQMNSDLFLLHRMHMPISLSKPILSRTLRLEYLSN